MNASTKSLPSPQGLNLALDVGHSSIGWALLSNDGAEAKPKPVVHHCGVVTFPADDCLAKHRRTYRRQRRHVRAIRQRIQRTAALLTHCGALSASLVETKHAQGGGHPAPWLLAARVLASNGAKEYLLSWNELWDVLRWYGHNRGYDGNKKWSRAGEEDEDDTEKVTNALEMMKAFDCKTMAETITRFMFKPHGVTDILKADPTKLPPFNLDPARRQCRYKGQNAAFPRDKVEAEVRRILEAHVGVLLHCDAALISALMDDGHAVKSDAIRLPKRYHGGLLFGQLLPRFENRILTQCPFTKHTVPSRHSFEFLRYRWAMQLANISVGVPGDKGLRTLNKDERAALNLKMQERGYLTPGELKAFVKEITGCVWSNLDAMLLHPDAKDALELYPFAKGKDAFRGVWGALTPKHRQLFANQMMRGKELTPAGIEQWLRDRNDAEAADKIAAGLAAGKKTKLAPEKLEALRAETIAFKKLSGRAPYSAVWLLKAEGEVLDGFDPRKESKASKPEKGEEKVADGCLVRTAEILHTALHTPLEKQTNNHLIRQRLFILEKLIKEIAADESLTGGRVITSAVIEVNRDLRAMSGMTAKEMASDMGLRLSTFKSAVAYLETAAEESPFAITPGLIRKTRVAMDLDWMCPYSGRTFRVHDLLPGANYDKDHVIPYSVRPSNSLESLVITRREINEAKGNRTALQFVEDMNLPENAKEKERLGICTPNQFRTFVDNLEARKGHDDDRKRKRVRKGLLMLAKWDEKKSGFTPGDLTVTSQIVRLGAQSVQRALAHLEPKDVISMPGSVTGELRKGWHLLGLLAEANPNVKDAETGEMKTKTEIRGVTHLHHALDACVLGLAGLYFPYNQGVWELIGKRNPTEAEKQKLIERGIYRKDAEGRLHLVNDLGDAVKTQIAEALKQKRVVQHVPKDLSGMKVEENTRRVVSITEGRAKLRQQVRDPKTGKLSVKETEEPVGKLVGLRQGKLEKQKGVRVITDNYGVAILDALPEGTPDAERFVIIPWHRVWHRLKDIKAQNKGKVPLIVRTGQGIHVAEGNFAGLWTVHSVKNNSTGMALDMGWPDVVTLANKTPGHKINVRLASLLKGGLRVSDASLAGNGFGAH
jgi:CRISPR-associated endonuclease Csn1